MLTITRNGNYRLTDDGYSDYYHAYVQGAQVGTWYFRAASVAYFRRRYRWTGAEPGYMAALECWLWDGRSAMAYRSRNVRTIQ
jgi:hypothetical protein